MLIEKTPLTLIGASRLLLVGIESSLRKIRSWIHGLVIASTMLPGLALAADPQIASFIDDPDPVVAGGIYTYSLRIDNNASDASSNTHLVVTVPAGAVFIQASPAAAACSPTSARVIDCALGSIGGLGRDIREVTLSWRALGPGPSTISATATLNSANDDNLANNSQTALTTVISGANLAIGKTASPNPVVGGGLISYTLRTTNAGTNDAGGLAMYLYQQSTRHAPRMPR